MEMLEAALAHLCALGVGSLLWLLFGGFALAISAALHGLLFCITIVGIPFGMQCFKFAKLALCPFGSSVAVPCAC